MLKKPLIHIIGAIVCCIAACVILSIYVPFSIQAAIGMYFIGAAGALFGISFYCGRRFTESPTDSMKELLDRIVREYTSGPCTVIDLTFKTPEMRDAMCAKLTDKLLVDLYREAAEEAKVVLDEDPKFYTRVIECKWPNNVNGNEGTKNIQVKQN